MQRIAVIGAGPSGIAAAKYLLDEDHFEVIDVFEQRNNVGGLWNYTPQAPTCLSKVPSVDPFVEEEEFYSGDTPTEEEKKKKKKKTKRVFISPMYDRLEVNIPRFQMRFRDSEFAPGQQLFPKYTAVQEYLEDYARDIMHAVRLGCRVDSLTKKDGESRWTLTWIDLASGNTSTSEYDGVAICTGHYSMPYIPDIAGIEAFEKLYPGSIQHSKHYRDPNSYAGKKVIVVGNSNSGIDVALHITEAGARLPVLQSCKKESPYLKYLINEGDIVEVSTISSFKTEERTVEFTDGRVEKDVDNIIFCTGYLYSLPFLNSFCEDKGATLGSQKFQEAEPSNDSPITNGFRVRRLYQNLFYIPDPSLTVIGLPVRIVPFPFTETQSAVVAGVYSGRLRMPVPEAEMREWEKRRLEEKGASRAYNLLSYPADADYMEMLNKWNDENPNPRARLKPTRWDKSDCLIREHSATMKIASIKAKIDGEPAPMTYADVGFDNEKGMELAFTKVNGISSA